MGGCDIGVYLATLTSPEARRFQHSAMRWWRPVAGFCIVLQRVSHAARRGKIDVENGRTPLKIM
jgi:hypothetical protein